MIPEISAAADDLVLGLVIVAITYRSLIAGELVPERIAQRRNARRWGAKT